MKSLSLILQFAVLGMTCSCTSTQSCHYFPKAFKTVEEAEHRLHSTECESLYDSTSFHTGGIRHAAFYTCDKKLGFMILRLNDRKQLFRNVPLQFWKNMRKAKSFEAYFRLNVEHKFPVYLETKIPSTSAL